MALVALASAALLLPHPPANARATPAHRVLLGRSARSACCRLSAADDECEIPLYDPLGDEIPFPFPTNSRLEGQTFRYVFDRPVYLRMLRAACGSDDGLSEADASAEDPAPIIGQCVKAGEGPSVASLALGPDSTVRAGTVGVALQLMQVEFGKASEQGAFAAATELREEVGLVRARAAFRFEITEVTGTIPYPRARVRRISDVKLESEEERARAAELENCLIDLLSKLIEISEKLEAAGPMAEAASAALNAPASLLQAHEEAVLGGEYVDAMQRWEALSLAVCEIIDLPHELAVEALTCTSPIERFEMLLVSMRPALAEMAALSSIDSLGPLGDDDLNDIKAAATQPPLEPAAAAFENGLTGFTPIDIPVGRGDKADEDAQELPDGTRIEYWYNEEYGWCSATVRRKLRTETGVLHTLEFDIDSTWEDVPLAPGRWRPMR